MFGIGGAGILQFASGGVFGAAAQNTGDAGAYTVLLVFFLVPLDRTWHLSSEPRSLNEGSATVRLR